MKKRWFSIYVLTAIILVLTACGTTKDNNDEANGNAVNPEEEIEVNGTNKDQDEDSSGEDGSVGENDKDSKDDEEIADVTTEFPNEAELVKSDEQDYSIYVLPNYSLTSEEPGKDSLYLDKDGSIFMRLETMLAEADTYDYLLENMLVSLGASSSDSTKPVKLEDPLPSGDSIENAQTYSVTSDTGSVIGVIFERNGIIVRLTVFDSVENKYFNDFLRMGETINKN